MNPFLVQLEAAFEQRQRQAAPLHLFFRDDDVDEDEAPLRRLLQLFLRWKTPINLGVIPGRLTAAGCELLRQSVSTAPPLLELNQHGWQHRNHERAGRKCEFGPSRTFAEQLADIAQGQARMNEAFGSDWFPVFIPPWNRCTEATCQVLDQLGFRGLSRDRGKSLGAGYRFRELPITLDLYRWRDGAQLRPTEEIVSDLIGQIMQGELIGVMLHHKVMDEEAFAWVATLLQVFKRHTAVQCHTFQQLLELTG
jgi:hypothetical protein